MKTVTFAFILLSFCLLQSCTSSSSDPFCKPSAESGTLVFAETGTLGSLFPHEINNATSQRIVSLIHEGLVIIDPQTLTIKPGIADTWRIDTTEKEYRFYLNSNVYFHDDACFPKGKGRKLTIDDVIYSLTMLCNKNEHNTSAETFIDQIEGAREYYEGKATIAKGLIKENDSTLLIRLTKPNPMFLQFLATPAAVIFPKEAYEEYATNFAVGVGPFYIKQFPDKDQPMILCKNQHYFKMDEKGNCLPYLDTIKIYFNVNLRQQLEMLKAGKLDIVMNVDNETFTNFLEQNIDLFQSKNAPFKAISGFNFASTQTQHIVKSNLENVKMNDIHQIDFRETKFNTDSLQTKNS